MGKILIERMKNSISNILKTLDTSVNSKAQVVVVIYLPSEESVCEQRLKAFECLCRVIHLPNYSFMEMKRGEEKDEVKTQYFLFCENWEKIQNADIKNRLKKYKISDPEHGDFRNYDYLDFTCSFVTGGKENAAALISEMRSQKKCVVGFIDEKNTPDQLPADKALLKELWGKSLIFANLTADETKELKCRMEHQHWCAEKILDGFRALNETELKDFEEFRLKDKRPLSESADWGMHKDMYAQKRMYAAMKAPAHLDLCAFDELMLRDFSTVHFDLSKFDEIINGVKKIDNKSKAKWWNKVWNSYRWVVYALISALLLASLLCRWESDIKFSGILGLFVLAVTLFWAFGWKNKFDRDLANSKASIWGVVLFLLAIPLTLALVLCPIYNLTDYLRGSLYWPFITQFLDQSNDHMGGRSMRFAVALFGMLSLNVILIPTAINFIERRVENWKNGKSRYNLKHSKHVIIIGGHNMVPGILKEINSDEIKYFVVMTELYCENYRTKLSAQVSKEIGDKLLVYHGDRTSKNDIQSLGVCSKSLQAVYIIGEGCSDRELEPNHDSKNMTCADLIAQEREIGGKGKLRCFVMFEHRSSYVAFQQSELSELYKKNLIFEPFNIFEMCAQNILVMPEKQYYPVRPIDVSQFSTDKLGAKRCIDIDSDQRVHLVIFGMSKIGMALASEAAIICHYPNYAKEELLEDHGIESKRKKEDLRMLITFIDLDGKQQMKFYQNRMPALFEISKWKYMDGTLSSEFHVSDKMNENPEEFEYSNLIDKDSSIKDKNFIDVEWEFINGAIGDPGVMKYLKDVCENANEMLTIAVCLPNGQEGLSLASTLPVDIYDKAEQIFVYQTKSDGIVRQMAGDYKETPMGECANRFSKLRPFGMYESCFNQDLLDNNIAKKVQKKNYEKLLSAIVKKEPTSSIELEELSSLTILERWSAVYSAQNWSVKFRSMGMLSGKLPSKDSLEKEFGPNSEMIQGTGESIRDLWGRVEHTRWMLERLIKIGERPINAREYEKYKNNLLKVKDHLKKSAQRSHLDICSMRMLKGVIDPGTVKYDIERNYRIVEIYEAIKEG